VCLHVWVCERVCVCAKCVCKQFVCVHVQVHAAPATHVRQAALGHRHGVQPAHLQVHGLLQVHSNGSDRGCCELSPVSSLTSFRPILGTEKLGPYLTVILTERTPLSSSLVRPSILACRAAEPVSECSLTSGGRRLVQQFACGRVSRAGGRGSWVKARPKSAFRSGLRTVQLSSAGISGQAHELAF
jgi:hypothetical protein